MTGALLLAAAFNVGSLPPIGHSDCEVLTNICFLNALGRIVKLFLAEVVCVSEG